RHPPESDRAGDAHAALRRPARDLRRQHVDRRGHQIHLIMAKLSVRAETPVAAPPKSGGKAANRVALTLPATPAAKKRRRSFGRPINAKGLAVFTRQLATLVKAGMPILRSLEVLARQEKRPGFKTVIESTADAIRSGGNFSDGLAANERVFDRLYVNMV